MNEDAFLAALLPRLGAADIPVPPGDDCAALPWRDGVLLLIAADQVVEGVHFYGPGAASPTPPELAGRKLLARNLSDIAAMGGRPTSAVLTLAVPRDRDVAWLTAFTDGVLALAAETGVRLVGGDTGSSPTFVATLTILGEVATDHVCRRDTARPGDRIFATGRFGGSLPTGRHLTFPPRLAEGAWLADGGWTRTMIDVSDGLLQDLGRLAAASNVIARLDLDAVPRTLETGGCVAGCAAGRPEAPTVPVDLRAALLDGEDYELLLTVPADRVAALRAAWPFATPLTNIGVCLAPSDAANATAAAPSARVIDRSGNDLSVRFGPGFSHFGA